MQDALSTRLRESGLDWIVPAWTAGPGVHAFCTTRNGGVSIGAGATLDMGGANAREPDVIANRARVRRFLPADPRWLQQVHGTGVVRLERVSDETAPGDAPVGDAAVTSHAGVVCAVRTADCLPVLFADRKARSVGVAHAGWRGLAAGVLEATVDALAAMGTPARDVVVWLGPAIGQDAFEVGEEVRTAFAAQDGQAAAAFRPGAPGKWHADLYTLARQRLARCGITDVHGGGCCTYTDQGRFFSYRRNPHTGRMAALIWLEQRGGERD